MSWNAEHILISPGTTKGGKSRFTVPFKLILAILFSDLKLRAKKKDWIWSQGKCRRVGLGDIILAALAILPWSFWNKWLSSTVPLCPANCFASVFLKQALELNRLFKKDRGKTASAARILSPNPTWQPLPCLLIKSFFYGENTVCCGGAWYCAVYNKALWIPLLCAVGRRGGGSLKQHVCCCWYTVCLTLCTYVFVVITRPIPSVYSEQNTRGFLRGVVTKTQTFCVEMNENTPRWLLLFCCNGLDLQI